MAWGTRIHIIWWAYTIVKELGTWLVKLCPFWAHWHLIPSFQTMGYTKWAWLAHAYMF